MSKGQKMKTPKGLGTHQVVIRETLNVTQLGVTYEWFMERGAKWLECKREQTQKNHEKAS